MSNIAIEVQNLSKAYQLGEIGTGTISRDLERWWAKFRGKEDPFLRIGETNDRTSKDNGNIVWSLKDIDFQVNQGDAIGIIGRNGAGKSTLLKILSRVTSPTTGSVKVKGRIASLLEVGTGFHPELTGRENIFLNGAILGMRKTEIKKHFDAIVDFAGVERYIDTPVKRYSSGMYVRLAFAVAAHLESEILIVDEVLAVGDTEFQKKCLGKMGDVSKGEGRTVLFVSHNLGAVKELCNNGILLTNGLMSAKGTASHVIDTYLRNASLKNEISTSDFNGPLKSNIIFSKISINNTSISHMEISPSQEIQILVEGTCIEQVDLFRTSCSLFKEGVRVLTTHDLNIPEKLPKGDFKSSFTIPAYLLRPGEYFIAIGGHDGNYLASGHEWIFGTDLMSFKIAEEYSLTNDFANTGIINISFNGKRITI